MKRSSSKKVLQKEPKESSVATTTTRARSTTRTAVPRNTKQDEEETKKDKNGQEVGAPVNIAKKKTYAKKQKFVSPMITDKEQSKLRQQTLYQIAHVVTTSKIQQQREQQKQTTVKKQPKIRSGPHKFDVDTNQYGETKNPQKHKITEYGVLESSAERRSRLQSPVQIPPAVMVQSSEAPDAVPQIQPQLEQPKSPEQNDVVMDEAVQNQENLVQNPIVEDASMKSDQSNDEMKQDDQISDQESISEVNQDQQKLLSPNQSHHGIPDHQVAPILQDQSVEELQRQIAELEQNARELSEQDKKNGIKPELMKPVPKKVKKQNRVVDDSPNSSESEASEVQRENIQEGQGKRHLKAAAKAADKIVSKSDNASSAVKSAKSSTDKPIMKAQGKEYRLKKEVHDEIARLMVQHYGLSTIPTYMDPEFSKSGQPFYNRIYDLKWPRVHIEETLLKQMVTKEPYPHYELSHHLYAEGPLKFGDDQHGLGIHDMSAFVSAKASDPKALNNLMDSLNQVLSIPLLKKLVDGDQLLKAFETYKFFGILCHHLMNMCQQHFKPKVGVVVENFMQIFNNRRVIEDCKLLKRETVKSLLKTLDKPENALLSAAIKAAEEENQLIDAAIQEGAVDSDVDHFKDGQTVKFPLLNGSAFRNPGVAQKSGACLCSDYTTKDRHTTDASESCNHSLGIDGHRQMLLQGSMNGASFFGSLLTTQDQLFASKYEDIASHFNSGLALSIVHMRDCPVAFSGSLEYVESAPKEEEKEVVDDAPRQNPVQNAQKVDQQVQKEQSKKNKKRNAAREKKKMEALEAKQKVYEAYEPRLVDVKISNLTGKIVLDQILSFDINSAQTVKAIYESLIQFMVKLHEQNYQYPLILQFDTLDPMTNEIASIVTNFWCKQTNFDDEGKPKQPFKYEIRLRNMTIKAAHIYQHEFEKYDIPNSEKKDHPYTKPFLNDLDYYSRPYETSFLNEAHVVSADAPRFKLTDKCIIKGQPDITKKKRLESEADQHLKQYDDQPELKKLMQWVFEQADLTSLGFRSAYEGETAKKNFQQATEKLYRLQPHKIRIFMPVITEPKVPASVNGGDVQLQKQFQLVQEALFLVFASNENFRHLQHCSEDRFGSQVMQILLGEKPWKAQDVLQLRVPEKIVPAKKFNAILTQFDVQASKQSIDKLSKKIGAAIQPIIEQALEQNQLEELRHAEIDVLGAHKLEQDIIEANGGVENLYQVQQQNNPSNQLDVVMKEEMKVGDGQKITKHNLSLGFGAIEMFTTRLKEVLPPQVYCIATKVFGYYVNCMFDLKTNQAQLSPSILNEILEVYARNRIKAAILSSGPTDPTDKAPHLRTLVPPWPPYYLPILEFQKHFERDFLGYPKTIVGADGQRQEVEVKRDDPNIFDSDGVPHYVTLVCSQAHYRILIDQVFDCILSELLQEVELDEHSHKLFDDVYATPLQAYNRFQRYGLDFFNLHAFHSQQNFMEAYEKTGAYWYMHEHDKEKKNMQVFREQLDGLDTDDKRANHIIEGNHDYIAKNDNLYQVALKHYKESPEKTTHFYTGRHPRYQMLKLSEKVSRETQGGYRFYALTQKNNFEARQFQHQTVGQVSKLSKQQKESAMKEQKALKALKKKEDAEKQKKYQYHLDL